MGNFFSRLSNKILVAREHRETIIHLMTRYLENTEVQGKITDKNNYAKIHRVIQGALDAEDLELDPSTFKHCLQMALERALDRRGYPFEAASIGELYEVTCAKEKILIPRKTMTGFKGNLLTEQDNSAAIDNYKPGDKFVVLISGMELVYLISRIDGEGVWGVALDAPETTDQSEEG